MMSFKILFAFMAALLLQAGALQAQLTTEMRFFTGSGEFTFKAGPPTIGSLESKVASVSKQNMCKDSQGNIYVSAGNNIAKITSSGHIEPYTKFYIGGGFRNYPWEISAMAIHNNKLYIAGVARATGVLGVFNVRAAMVTIDLATRSHTVIFDCPIRYAGGRLEDAKFGEITGIAIDESGNLVHVIDAQRGFTLERTIDLTNNTVDKPNLARDRNIKFTRYTVFSTGNRMFTLTGTVNAATGEKALRVQRFSSAGWFVQAETAPIVSTTDPNSKLFENAYSARFSQQPDGTLLFTVPGLHKIYRLNPETMETSVLVGTGAAIANESGDDDNGENIAIHTPSAIVALDNDSLLFISDELMKVLKVRRVPPAPPAARYPEIPGNLCTGSFVNQAPVNSGPQAFYAIVDSVDARIPIALRAGYGNRFLLVDSVEDEFQNVSEVIVRLNADGTVQDTLNQFGFVQGIEDLVEDKYGRIYVLCRNGFDQSVVSRLNADGSLDFQFGTAAGLLNAPVSLALGKDGNLYISDPMLPGILKLDTLGNGSNKTPTTYYTGSGFTQLAMGKGNRMFALNPTQSKIYTTLLTASPEFTEAFPGLDTLGYEPTAFFVDTLGAGNLYVSSATSGKVGFVSASASSDYTINNGNYPLESLQPLHDFVPFISPSAIIRVTTNLSVPYVWILEASDKIKTFSVFAYSISPALPEGLTFDFHQGTIVGTPTAPAAPTTYTITRYSDAGTTSTTINFSVNTPGPVSNATQTTRTTPANHPDGLNINYYERNDCSQIVGIEDTPGGTTIGNVQVVQERFPTVASFGTGTFVPRVTLVNTTNPEAEARLRLFFTFLDIKNYNDNNGTDPDLANDTLSGTMADVGILQLHTNPTTGRTEQIRHYPITATWVPAPKSVWEVDFPIEKFSTFYAGHANVVAGFDCESTQASITNDGCGSYDWDGIILYEAGTYTKELTNATGCDSIITLDLTLTNDLTMTQDDSLLTVTQQAATSYQWVSCDNDYAEIDGATGRSFIAPENGNYAVIVTANSCADTSDCVYVFSYVSGEPSAVQPPKRTLQFEVFPNPGDGHYTLRLNTAYTLEVTNMVGTTLLREARHAGNSALDLSHLPQGVYTLRVATAEGQHTKLVVKQ